VARLVLPQEKVCSVVAFPLSSVPSNLKLAEAVFSAEEGAGELDIVADIGAIKEGNWKKLEDELKEIRNALSDRIIKLIIECCYLTDDEKEIVCRLAVENGWDYVKTSTGYGTYGAEVKDVEFL